jgi:hypothetical protein
VTGQLIFPARRALEQAVTTISVRPLRLFPVLWPLWRVEVSARVYDEQAYEVVDRFLVRAVHEAGFTRVDQVAAFLGVHLSLVQRCLAFLTRIGHVSVDGGEVRMTPLGVEAIRAGVRYEPKESRQDLLFDQFTSWPLPRGHYDGSVTVLPTPEVPADSLADRTHFTGLYCGNSFVPDIVPRLAQRPDRTEFNLPRLLRDVTVEQHANAYLPVYLVETADSGLLAYTSAEPRGDEFIQAVCREVPAVLELISAEEPGDPREIWTGWLAEGRHGRGTLRQLPNGVWRTTLRPQAYGAAPKLPPNRIGSFELRRRHFLQLWCDDTALRRRVLMDRALGIAQTRDVSTREDLVERMSELAELLEARAPSLAELRTHGETEGQVTRVARLDDLA